MMQERPLLRIVIAGHVDHGKSSLIGRLLHDTGALPEGKYEELRAASERRAMPLEWSFLVDALQAERDQAVTIDSTQIWFKTRQRDYVIIDAPGHREFLRNMITGASQADAALLVIDATEGVRDTTRRHAYLLRLLGIRELAVAVNKMDLAQYAPEAFDAVAREIASYLDSIGLKAAAIVPISARGGDNIAHDSPSMPWHRGPTVLAVLDRLAPRHVSEDLPLRLPIQDVYKFDERRILAGRIESGVLQAGDTLLFSPSNRTAKVRAIEAWNEAAPPLAAAAGRSVGITLDEPLFVERGEIASHERHAPVLSDVFGATVFWLGRRPLQAGRTLKLRHGSREVLATVRAIKRVIDTDTLGERGGDEVEQNGVAEIVVRCPDLLAVDEHSDSARTGRFVLIDGHEAAGGGLISVKGYPDQRASLTVRATNITRVAHRVAGELRAHRNGHRGGVLWFTGLSGAGKSTIAMEVERRLFAKGYQVYVLDGDNLRGGLNANLGFGPQDRSENIRRVGEVAALFADAGQICITALISPYQADRDRARAAAKAGFHEVHIKADLAVCEKRDAKGLYRRARAGEIAEFTGISAPYEAPAKPELVVDSGAEPLEACVRRVLDYIERNFAVGARAEAEPAVERVP